MNAYVSSISCLCVENVTYTMSKLCCKERIKNRIFTHNGHWKASLHSSQNKISHFWANLTKVVEHLRSRTKVHCQLRELPGRWKNESIYIQYRKKYIYKRKNTSANVFLWHTHTHTHTHTHIHTHIHTQTK
jgi:hypothetical protein